MNLQDSEGTVGGTSQVYEQSQGQVPHLAVFPQAGETLCGQQNVCLEPGGGQSDRADGGHHPCHSWQYLPWPQCPEQVSIF